MSQIQGWSRKHTCCVRCGTIAIPHHGRGLCKICYRETTQHLYYEQAREYHRKNIKNIMNRHKKYYQDNKERIDEQKRQYRLEHIEEYREYARKGHYKNHEKRLQQKKIWRENHKEYCKEYNAKWRAENREHYLAYQREYHKNRKRSGNDQKRAD